MKLNATKANEPTPGHCTNTMYKLGLGGNPGSVLQLDRLLFYASRLHVISNNAYSFATNHSVAFLSARGWGLLMFIGFEEASPAPTNDEGVVTKVVAPLARSFNLASKLPQRWIVSSASPIPGTVSAGLTALSAAYMCLSLFAWPGFSTTAFDVDPV